MHASMPEKGYFVFGYYGKSRAMELEFLGWHKVRLLPDEPAYIEGVLSLLGRHIPVFQPQADQESGRAEAGDEACVAVCQCDCLKRHFAAIVTENITGAADLGDLVASRFALMAADLVDRPVHGPRDEAAIRPLTRLRAQFAGCRGRFGAGWRRTG